MWACRKCRETIEGSFDVCWRCGTTKEGVEDPDFKAQQEGVDERESEPDQASAFKAGKPVVVAAPPAESTPKQSSAVRHLFARCLVWALRGIALLVAIAGLSYLSTISAMTRPFEDPATKRAATSLMFSAVISIAAFVATLLAIAEILRLCLLIERKSGNHQ
jgi:hypothetical protein